MINVCSLEFSLFAMVINLCMRRQFVLFIHLVECLLQCVSQGQPLLTKLSQFADVNASSSRRLLEWANVYPGITSSTVPMDCQFQDKPLCCSALQNPPPEDRDGISLEVMSSLQHKGVCVTHKEYFPSPYETRHLKKAKEISLIPDRAERHGHLLDFIASPEEVRAAQKWLERVRVHMGSGSRGSGRSGKKSGSVHSGGYNSRMKRLRRAHGGRSEARQRALLTGDLQDPSAVHPDDEEYMSKFVLTTTCSGEQGVEERVEWIEPLSVHGRHPFGE